MQQLYLFSPNNSDSYMYCAGICDSEEEKEKI